MHQKGIHRSNGQEMVSLDAFTRVQEQHYEALAFGIELGRSGDVHFPVISGKLGRIADVHPFRASHIHVTPRL